MALFLKLFSFIKKNPVRSFLTLLQLALGVAIAILVINLSFNLQKIESQGLSQYSSDFGVFNIQRSTESVHSLISSSTRPIEQPSLAGLVADDPSIKTITSLASTDRVITANGRSYVTIAYRGDHRLLDVIPLKMLHGSYISKDDEGKYIAVISETYAKLLFGKTDVIGQNIQTQKYTPPSVSFTGIQRVKTEFSIIGVFKDLSYLERKTLGKIHFIHTNEADAASTILTPTLYVRSTNDRLPEVHTLLNQKAQVIYGNTTTVNQKDLVLYKNSSLQGLGSLKQTLTLIAIAAIIVSSIGILSIMISSVFEKTHEIGIKRALGATKQVIFSDILKETAYLTLIGSLIGVILAKLVSPLVYREMTISIRVLQDFRALDFHMIPLAFFFTVLAALLLGTIFGIYPAKLAAEIPPAEALRE
ncbi:MAG: FtsX-like permease family protein [Firmicutes bacterium]|nr:FtsX-like permease family protein [Bacillota bacterium]